MRFRCALFGACCLLASQAEAFVANFNFNGGPQYGGTPLDQFDGNVKAHFWGGIEPGYSIQDIGWVIGVTPTGFSGLGLSPSTVYLNDLHVSFAQTNGNPLFVQHFTGMVAPQELACDSSSTIQVTAYMGANFVGTQTYQAPVQDFYMWPTVYLDYTNLGGFDNLVIHFDARPPTGGDWGPIFVADNFMAENYPLSPEPGSIAALGAAIAALAIRRRRR